MARWQYSKGLHHLGGGSYGYLLPDGGWGWSNTGLVVDGDQTLLVDTLINLDLTTEMLRVMADGVPASKKIDILVNSHSDADHTFGNQLVKGARIVSSKATAEEFFKLSPGNLQAIIGDAERLGDGARFLKDIMPPDLYDFSQIALTGPTETFEGQGRLKVGDKDVVLHELGPAHTRGDTVVQVVQDRVVYTGDLLFIGVHPAIWDGSLDGWIAACDRILALDIDVVVPGHGPVTDKPGVREFRSYLVTIRDEVRKRFEAGLSVEEAAMDIIFSPPYADWICAERVIGSVNFLYRQWGSEKALTDFLDIFAMLRRYQRKIEKRAACDHAGPCDHAH